MHEKEVHRAMEHDAVTLESLSIEQLEHYIQCRADKVDGLRAEQRRAHDILERKNLEAFRHHRENLPADYPPDQGVGG